ncbi:MAG TPA: hypothetical protein VEI28_03415, partial [Thermodesulfovibrionales bacterium]|nr:hypothetical protein [Thermodesulfovibrionales bacterium]
MKLKPLHDWIVLERAEAEERSSGGIIIPDTAKGRPSEGVVVSVGPGSYKKVKGKEKFVPTTLQPGQRVAYPQYMAKEVEAGGEEFILVREDDILGTFEGWKSARKGPERQSRPPVAGGLKETIQGASAKKRKLVSKGASNRKMAQKGTTTSGKKKPMKKIMAGSVTIRTGPKAVKKADTKKMGKPLTPQKTAKKTTGPKKATGKGSPSKSISPQKKRT